MNASALNLKIPRLGKNRHGVFYVRFSALDASGRRRVFQNSLGTKNPHLAKVLALKFCLTLASGNSMSDFRHLIAPYGAGPGGITARGEDDHRRAMEAYKLIMEGQIRLAEVHARQAAVASVLAPSVSSGKRLREVFDLHLVEEQRSGLTQQTIGEKRALFRDFIDVFQDVPVGSISKAEISASWRNAEFRRPNKKHAGETLSLARLEKRRGYLSKFFVWATQAGYYKLDNPVSQKMGEKKLIKAARQSYVEFSGDDLAALFRAAYAVRMDKPDFYWLPLMALFSGARLSELANLELGDVREIEGIKVYQITKGKTVESQRTVPIHSQLLALGFWAYVQMLKNKNETHLLPFRPEACREKAVGRMWGLWVDECKVTNKRKTFHSFRSTAITDLHNSAAGHAAIRTTVGHATQGTTGAHGGYIRGIDLVKRMETIEMLNYPTIPFEMLKLADPTFLNFFTNENAKANDPKNLIKAESLIKHKAAQLARETRLAKSKPKVEAP